MTANPTPPTTAISTHSSTAPATTGAEEPSGTVLVNVDGPVGSIMLNRPEALNALTFEMLGTVRDALAVLGANPAVRVITLSGAGKAFCAGDDLIDMGTERVPVPDNKIDEFMQGYPMVCMALRECPKPVVAILHKFAMGAGLELALASDFIVADEDTKIGLPFVLRGFSSGTNLIPRLTNRLFASRLLFTGEFVNVKELDRFGLVTEFTEPGHVHDEAATLVNTLASLPTKSITLMKDAMRSSDLLDERSAWLIQAHSTVSSTLTEDHAEGRAAFREKRDPSFTGR